MSYWRGLIVAAVMDVVWIAGCPSPITEPARAPAVQQLLDIDARINDLMVLLQQRPRDVSAMQQLAHLYAQQGWHDQAIGPLARALQLDPSGRSLWVALDEAVRKSGRETITDAELVRRAAEFVELVEMWGHGC